MASKAAAAAESRAQTLQSQRDAVANESEQGSSLWEKMQHSELAAAAAAAGMRVSDYEAQQQLAQAIHESTASDAPAETSAATEQVAVTAAAADDSEANMIVAADSDSDDDDDCDDTASSVSSIDPAAVVLATTDAAADTEPSSEQPEEDRNIMLELSDDALRRIMLYLEPEAIAQCCIVHRHWTFGKDEGLCEELCRRIYLQQTRKHSLSVTRWKSWRRMLINRPRLRTSGMYILRHSHMKKPQIDMFTEIKRGTVLECIYYR
jgi:hypothetical protein